MITVSYESKCGTCDLEIGFCFEMTELYLESELGVAMLENNIYKAENHPCMICELETQINRLSVSKQEILWDRIMGPGEEDGPWAAGWHDRYGKCYNLTKGCVDCNKEERNDKV